MHPALRTLYVFLQIVGGIALYIGTGALLYAIAPWLGLLGDSVLILVNGWAIYAFLRYRQRCQDELAQVVAAAVNASAPLAGAIRSYADVQPRRRRNKAQTGFGHEIGPRDVLTVLVCIALPLYTYVRLCIGWRRFDRLVAELAERLEAGEPLPAALRAVPGVASRSFRLAAAVGESTGSLGSCLRSASEERWTGAWLEIAPRLAYPFVVLFFVYASAMVIWVKVLPKFKMIYADFGMQLPPVTQDFADAGIWIAGYGALFISLANWLFVIALAAVVANPTVRWRTPVVGRLYRWGVQAEILRTLGLLLAAGRTVPQALEILRSCKDLPSIVRGRLNLALVAVECGDSLDGALEYAGLLPKAMGPLVRAAERARTLPWAVRELGDHLAGRAFRLMRRISLVAFPLMIVAVGTPVIFTALAIFMPMIHLMRSLGE